MEFAFWIAISGVVYAYFGYPIILALGAAIMPSRTWDAEGPAGPVPFITILIPVHNEAAILSDKLENTLALEYPGEMEIIVVSDGSSDRTTEIAREYAQAGAIKLIELTERRGKGNALNNGVGAASGEIIVFSDASIMLDSQAAWNIVKPFSDPNIGCVSGEDRIAGPGGEGLYGRYELWLRRLESKTVSIAGASGSLYAERKVIVKDFHEGMAPDFLSVLNALEAGYRAISTRDAVGVMSAASTSTAEFSRKVRTVIRGMTALFAKSKLLNPFRYPGAAFVLLSHKIMRWLVPFFLIGLLASSIALASDWKFGAFVVAQITFYTIGLLGLVWQRLPQSTAVVRVATYFTLANAAIAMAWGQVYFWYQTRDLGTDSTLCLVALPLTTPITVLDLRDSPWVDGPGRTILETAESIDSRRVKIIIAGFSTAQGGTDAYLGEARKRGLPVRPIIERKALDWRVIEQVLRVIDEYKVDVLHTHDFRSDLVGLICASRRKIPIVTTCHGWISNDLKGRVYTWVDKSVLRYFDHIVTVSGAIKRQLLNAGLPDSKVEVIPNALKVDDFVVDKEDRRFRNKLDIPDHWKIIANIGRLSEEKGQVLLLRAFADACQVQKNICLVFVGIGPEERRLEELAMNLNIEDRVYFAGFQENMNAVYNSVNLVVQSSFTEGMPNVVLESLLMETPVVATDVGGTAEIIVHNESGYLMEPNSHEEILSGILNFLNSESDFTRMARRGRTHVKDNFDNKNRVKRLESMYQRVITSKGKLD